jgi:thiol peroxidase
LGGPHILARAIIVVDTTNTVRYLQVTPELTQLPDMEEAFRFARSLITAS